MDAYDGLLGLIRRGELRGDVKVSEASLAARLGVSRTPVREALRVLDAQRLVVSQGRGVRARVPGARELAEAFETRCALESFAAQEAATAQRAGLLLPARLREVERLAVSCDQATRVAGALAGAEENRTFHLALAALPGNSQINALLTAVWDQIIIATRAGLTTTPRVNDVHREHEAILQAISRGRPDQARSAVSVHVDHTRRISLNSIDETETHA
ncbi:GntR family transcriptional regulator [Mycolicibacterium sp. 624]|uniref:GntR family transcriptional regulator n=1 Tax=Mycolicibacterium sp. 624 TaxID=3156314 RepID=UPI0033990666